MDRDRELAEAVREMCECDGSRGVKWDALEYSAARQKVIVILAQILDQPQQPAEASGVVARLRELGSEDGPFRISRFEFLTAADELEALQRRVADLKIEYKAAMETLQEAEKDRKQYLARIAELKAQLQSREPMAGEVDWEALGKVGHVFDSGLFADPCEWEELDEGTRQNYIESAKMTIAAYEQNRRLEKSDV